MCEARGRHGADAARAPGRPSAAPACTRRSTRNMCNERVLAAGSSPSGPMTTRASTTRAAHYTTPQEQAQLSAYFTRLRIQVSRRAHLARFRARARARAAALAPAPAARVVRLPIGCGLQCTNAGSRLRRRTGLAHRRSKGTRARARVRIATVRSLRAIGARRAAAACWQHSGTATTQHACTWRSIHGGRCAAVAGHGLVIRHELARLAASGRIGRC